LLSKIKLPRVLYISLLSIAGALAAILIIGTIIALFRPKNAEPLFRLGKAGEVEQAGTAQIGEMSVFSGMGRLRIPLANSSTLVLTIAFPYSASDTAFTEELAGKIGEFRVIASDYFSSLPAEKIIVLDEEAAKQEILRRYNAVLRLGRIEALYFSDLLIIDAAL